jgi:riboflavin synthase
MFTGIIEETGTVESVRKGSRSAVLSIKCQKVLEGTTVGASIAVNGVCLTVTTLKRGGFTADVMTETWDRTGLKNLAAGGRVHLERAMAAGRRFDGHMVSGHVDRVVSLQAARKTENTVYLEFRLPVEDFRFLVPHGSVAVDGVSLTVQELAAPRMVVALIPHTATHTTLAGARTGSLHNIEYDIMGKYGAAAARKQPISRDFLEEHGF